MQSTRNTKTGSLCLNSFNSDALQYRNNTVEQSCCVIRSEQASRSKDPDVQSFAAGSDFHVHRIL